MVFCSLPSQLSEEEKFLQQKYQKLKKKKKLLQQQKIPKPEQLPTAIQTSLKRSIDGGVKQDAKELAKKLIKSGAISAIKPPEKEKQGFKRSKTLQRKKLEQAEKPKYQPFSAVQKWDSDLEGEPGNGPRSSITLDPKLPAQEKEAFAREATFREKKRDGKAHYINRDIPNVGNTIYVHGIGINETLLKNGFASHGNILNINVEYNRNCGFITFESIDEANKAIDVMNGQQLNNILLKVTLARKQPLINRPGFAPGTSAALPEIPSTPAHHQPPPTPVSPFPAKVSEWTAIAAQNTDPKSNNGKEKRSLIAYDDIY